MCSVNQQYEDFYGDSSEEEGEEDEDDGEPFGQDGTGAASAQGKSKH